MNIGSRRKVLQGLAVGAPVVWTKPVVDTVMLPAHAGTTTIICIFDGVAGQTNTGGAERAFVSVSGGPSIDYTNSGSAATNNSTHPILVCGGAIGVTGGPNNIVICVDGVDRMDGNGYTYQNAVEGTNVGGTSCEGGRVYGIDQFPS